MNIERSWEKIGLKIALDLFSFDEMRVLREAIRSGRSIYVIAIINERPRPAYQLQKLYHCWIHGDWKLLAQALNEALSERNKC